MFFLKDGVWVIQFTDLLSTFELNAFDNICHEHLEYYSLTCMINLFAEFDLEIFAIDHSTANGASIRAFVGNKGEHSVEKSVSDYKNKESDFFKDKKLAYKKFADSIQENKKLLADFIKENPNTFVLGASTKGNTLLQYFGLGHKEIKYALEVNSDKYGRKTVVSNIPIINQDEGLKLKPDALLILPWHFLDFFQSKLDSYLKQGGKLVVPLPHFKVYSK